MAANLGFPAFFDVFYVLDVDTVRIYKVPNRAFDPDIWNVLENWNGRELWVRLNETKGMPFESGEAEVCTLHMKGGVLTCSSQSLFLVNGIGFSGKTVVKGGSEVRVGDAIQPGNNNNFDMNQVALTFKVLSPMSFELNDENDLDMEFLHALLSLGRFTELQSVANLKIECVLREQSRNALIALIRSCAGINKAIQADWAVYLLKALAKVFDDKQNNGRWFRALQASLPFFVLDILKAEKDRLMQLYRDLNLRKVPVEGQIADASPAILREARSSKFELKTASVTKIKRSDLKSESLSLSESDPFSISMRSDGRWWLETGNCSFAGFRKHELVPLYSGCRLRVGPHVLEFLDPQASVRFDRASDAFGKTLLSIGMKMFKWTTKMGKAENTRSDKLAHEQQLVWADAENQDCDCAWALMQLASSMPMCNQNWVDYNPEVFCGGSKSSLRYMRLEFHSAEYAWAASERLPFFTCGYDRPKPMGKILVGDLPLSDEFLDSLNSDKISGLSAWKVEARPKDAKEIKGAVEKISEDDWKKEKGKLYCKFKWLCMVLICNRHLESHWKEFEFDWTMQAMRRGSKFFLFWLLRDLPFFRLLQ